jgi:hypothetical protein
LEEILFNISRNRKAAPSLLSLSAIYAIAILDIGIIMIIYNIAIKIKIMADWLATLAINIPKIKPIMKILGNK